MNYYDCIPSPILLARLQTVGNFFNLCPVESLTRCNPDADDGAPNRRRSLIASDQHSPNADTNTDPALSERKRPETNHKPHSRAKHPRGSSKHDGHDVSSQDVRRHSKRDRKEMPSKHHHDARHDRTDVSSQDVRRHSKRDRKEMPSKHHHDARHDRTDVSSQDVRRHFKRDRKEMPSRHLHHAKQDRTDVFSRHVLASEDVPAQHVAQAREPAHRRSHSSTQSLPTNTAQCCIWSQAFPGNPHVEWGQ
jgi:hypothetical protein